MDKNLIRNQLQRALAVINEYKWMFDAYVLDFYVCDYWSRLPHSFKALENFSHECLVEALLTDENKGLVLPLSILALKKLEKTVCISRETSGAQCTSKITTKGILKSFEDKVQTELEKRLKPKKLHEIQKMVELCDITTKTTKVDTIIDFGSGLGHLSRHLQYKLDLSMICIEQNEAFIEEAKRIDVKLEGKYQKYSRNHNVRPRGRIFHIKKRLNTESDFHEVLKSIKNNFNFSMEGSNLGLIGLHPCGDLAVLLLKSFLRSNEVKFLKIVGCCYMKLTTASTYQMEGRILTSNGFSYPLSSYLKNHVRRENYELSYTALESATHAKEKYLNDVLLQRKNTEFYKINSFRAAIEFLIVKYYPEKCHSGLRNVRYDETLSFSQYCSKALSGLSIKIPEEDINSLETETRLKQWKRVAIFHLLRLFLSPFVENVLLYDRQLFLMENGCNCEVKAVFDPLISPRCHVMSAIKVDL